MTKILTLDDSTLKEIKKKYKKIVLAHGVFDLLHIGHLRYLKKAKSLGDCLIVSVTNDENVNKGINRPFFDENLRMEAISQISSVNYVILSKNKNSEKIIRGIKPKIYVKGAEYKTPPKMQLKNYKDELNAINSVGAKFKIIEDINFSSSSLINSNFDKLNIEQKQILQNIIIKKKINFEKITEKKIKEPIFIFGDIIIDKFIFTQSLGKSRKNNIISTRFKKVENYDGGSLMIAKILSKYFSNISMLTHLNKKEITKLKKRFKEIKFVNIENKNSGLITKTRYVDEYNLTKIFQVNENDQMSLDKLSESKIMNKLFNLANNINNIVITDFGHGLISEKICKMINNLKNNKFINCQANSSNFGYNKFTKYKYAKLLSCDEDELRLSLNDNNNELHSTLKKNIKKFKNIKRMIVTSGKQGSYCIEKRKIDFIKSLKINNMIDSIGCGDVFFSYLIILDKLKKIKFSNLEIMILCHLAASLHSKYFANSQIIDRIEFIKGLKSFSA